MLVLALQNTAKAQNQTHIDSLMERLEEPELSKKTETQILNQLAWEYKDFQPETAVEFGNKALKIANKINYSQGLADAYKNIGVAQINQKKYIEALTVLFQALALKETTNDKQGRAECLNYIGDAYKGRKNYSEAIRHYIKAVELFEEIGNKKGTLRALNNLSDTYFKQARYNNALKFAYKSITIAEEIGAAEESMEAFFTLSEVYSLVGDYRRAYEYYTLYTEVKDSLYKEARIAELQKKESEFEEIQQTQLEKARKRNSRNFQYLLISVLFIILFVSPFFMGKLLPVPPQIMKVLIFTSLFLTSQFLLLLIRPYIEEYTGGLPIILLFLNATMAFAVLMIHRFVEGRLRSRVVKPLEEKQERVKAIEKSRKRREELSTANDNK